jgi:hypothetical protein
VIGLLPEPGSQTMISAAKIALRKKQIGAALQLKPETREFIADKARSR